MDHVAQLCHIVASYFCGKPSMLATLTWCTIKSQGFKSKGMPQPIITTTPLRR